MTTKPIPPSPLLERLRRHDERAFNELVQVYQRRVFAIVYRMVGNREEAEDITQEVFVQVFKAIGTFRGDAQLSTWIYRIAVNLSKNRLKYNQRRLASSHAPLAADDAGGAEAPKTSLALERPDQLYAGKQLEAAVLEALASLDPDFREVLVLREFEGLSYEQIAEITNVAIGTVRSRIHRARAQLKTGIQAIMGEKVQ